MCSVSFDPSADWTQLNKTSRWAGAKSLHLVGVVTELGVDPKTCFSFKEVCFKEKQS